MFQLCVLLVLKVHFKYKRWNFSAGKIRRAAEWTWILRKSRRNTTFRCLPVAILIFCKAETSFLVPQLSLAHIPLKTKKKKKPALMITLETVLGRIFLPPGLEEEPIQWVICRSVVFPWWVITRWWNELYLLNWCIYFMLRFCVCFNVFFLKACNDEELWHPLPG